MNPIFTVYLNDDAQYFMLYISAAAYCRPVVACIYKHIVSLENESNTWSEYFAKIDEVLAFHNIKRSEPKLKPEFDSVVPTIG